MRNKLLVLFLMLLIFVRGAYSQDNGNVATTISVDGPLSVSPAGISGVGISDTSSILDSSDSFGSSTKEKKPNAFIAYMKGRNKVGINLAPNISMYGASFIGNKIVKSDTVSSFLTDVLPHSEDDSVVPEFNIRVKGATWGLSLYYDFTVLSFMSISFEAGFVNASFSLEQVQYITYSDGDTDIGLTDYNLTYRILPYSIGVKLFPWQQAPWGFYLMPKFGGTCIEIVGNVTASVASSDMAFELPIAYTSGHGFYTSLEIGYNVKLFPNMSKNWGVEIGIDIALLDIGYYFGSWATGLIDNLDGGGFLPESVSKYLWASNIRAIVLPKLGFSVKF